VKVASLCSRSSRSLPSNTSGVGFCRKQAQPYVVCQEFVVLCTCVCAQHPGLCTTCRATRMHAQSLMPA
jgi:hypothetical protein